MVYLKLTYEALQIILNPMSAGKLFLIILKHEALQIY